jgi:hypothetical protein
MVYILQITNDKNINKKNFLLVQKFFGFAEKTENFFINYVFFHEKTFLVL